MKWLMRLLGLRPEYRAMPDLAPDKRRSDAVLVKAERVATSEETRLEQMRQSFRRANQRLGG